MGTGAFGGFWATLQLIHQQNPVRWPESWGGGVRGAFAAPGSQAATRRQQRALSRALAPGGGVGGHRVSLGPPSLV